MPETGHPAPRAGRERLDLDLARSVWIGDRSHDVAPARHFDGRGILIPSPDSPADEVARAEREAEVASSRDEIVARVLGDAPSETL